MLDEKKTEYLTKLLSDQKKSLQILEQRRKNIIEQINALNENLSNIIRETYATSGMLATTEQIKSAFAKIDKEPVEEETTDAEKV